MNALTAIARELFGLFVDDGWLALSVLAIIGFSALVLTLVPNLPLIAAGVLLFGCLAILFTNVARAIRSP
jgi:hypothetical protein